MDDRKEQQEDVKLPEERVEDLEPGEGESDDVTGGGGAVKGGWAVGESRKV